MRKTLLLNKAFQPSVYNRQQRFVSCIPPVPSSVRAMILVSDNVQSPVPRRTDNYHSDLWNDDVLHSLNSPYHHAPPYQQWADNLVAKVKEMFRALEDGEISPSAYDTAWIAMVPAKDGSHTPQFPQAIKWLISNQLEDGSWGLPSTFLLCDRLLSTLASLVALLTWNTGHTSIEKGVRFIEDNLKCVEEEDSLSPDFEIIFPALMKKAEYLGLSLPYNTFLLKKRATLLAEIKVEGDIVTRNLVNALEGLEEIIDWNMIMKFQSKDGSFLSSPASTACVLINTGDERCFNFLNDLMHNFTGSVPCLYPIDLLERLSLVDNIERLGIGRHFKEEIKLALDYVYGESLFADLNTTALGLRTFRIHGYNVSPDVLNNFKDESGCFFSCSGQRHIEHRSMLNLFRACDLAFPGENIMDEARLFASNYLRESLKTVNILSNEKIVRETEYALEYSWHQSLSNLEARSYIDAYDENHPWLRKTLFKMSYVNNTYCMELAKLYFNIEQSLHQEDLKLISSWWKESCMQQMDFARQRIVEFYISVILFEPEYSLYRIAFTKIFGLETVIDDMYDTYGTVEELRAFTKVAKRWDTSLIEDLPDYMKIVFKAWYEGINEIIREVTEQQGRDMVHHIRKDNAHVHNPQWDEFLEAMMHEREWTEASYIPTLEEYLKTRCVSVGLGPSSHPMFLLGEVVRDDDLPLLQNPAKCFQLVSLLWRLQNDIGTLEREKARGQPWSFTKCYMRDNPTATEEDALNYFKEIVSHGLKELNYEYFKSIGEPTQRCKMFFYKMRIIVMLFYNYGDGYGDSTKETKECIRKTLSEPMQLW